MQLHFSRENHMPVSNTIKRGRGLATGAGVTAALAGIVASSCCVLPLLFAGFGLGGASLVVVPALAIWRPYLLGAAIVALTLAWIFHLRPVRPQAAAAACSAAGIRRLPLWLVLASVLVLLALAWQSAIEPQLLLLLR